MSHLKTRVLCFVLFLLTFSSSAFASLYLSSGKYVFHVRAVNNSYKEIPQARGRVFISGNSARIDVEAPGYRSGYEYVYLRDNVTSYAANVRLDEPTIWINMLGSNHKPIASASTSHYSQNMYWADEFGFTGQFPKAGFEKITARDFQVRINSLYAFAPRVYLTSNGDSWRFEIVVKRRDMNSMFTNRFEVIVKCDPEESAPTYAEVAELAADYCINMEMAGSVRDELTLNLLQNRLESNAVRILSAYTSLGSDEQAQILAILANADALVQQLKTMTAFEDMHH